MKTELATRKSKSKAVAVSNAADLEFRKSNEAVGLRVVEGSLTLLTRKIFNLMIYHAQQMREPGLNAPIRSGSASKYFWIPLSDLARDAAYNSNDAQYLREQLQSLQDIKLVRETERQWTSERLVSSVTMVNPQSSTRGGHVWVGFAFPPEVYEQVMSPSAYTRFSIVYQSALRSGASLALYEICRRYATNPSHKTFIQSLEYWHASLTGTPLDPEKQIDFKYFNRDVLKPCIAEVNQVTDIKVELIIHKSGRKVSQLQFEVYEKKQASLEFPAPPIVDTGLVKELVDFGLDNAVASDLAAETNHDVLRRALGLTRDRVNNRSLSPVQSPAAYLRWQIGELIRKPDSTTPQLAAVPPAEGEGDGAGKELLERFHAERGHAALDLYKNLSDLERTAAWEKFKSDPKNRSLKTDKGLESTAVRKVFSHWYAHQTWGEPRAEDIARFAEYLAAKG